MWDRSERLDVLGFRYRTTEASGATRYTKMATPYVTDESGKAMHACTFVFNAILSGNPATIIKGTFIFSNLHRCMSTLTYPMSTTLLVQLLCVVAS